MRNQRLQGRVTAGWWTLPVAILFCTLSWVLTFFLLPGLSPSRLLSSAWIEHLASFFIYAIVGYFLIELNNRFNIIRVRASVQTSIYFLWVTVCPELHLFYAGDIAAIAFLISLYFLFDSYQKPRPVGYLFHSFFFIGAGSLLFPQFTFFAPLWLIGAYRFQSLTFRSLCGALLGWALPYWLLFGYAFIFNRMELFYAPFHRLVAFSEPFNLQTLPSWTLATLGFLLAMFIVSAAHCIIAGFEDKIKTRTYLRFLIDFTLFTFLFTAAQPSLCNDLLPLLMISCSILMGHLFALTNSKTSNFFFIIVVLGFLLLFGYNTWMLL